MWLSSLFLLQNSSASINSNDLGANHSTASLNSNDLSSNNFATLRTSSILTRQIKEHEKKDQMYEQMSGYKIMRRQHQKALIQLEDKCRRELEDHKQKLEKEYDNLLQQFSKELEKLMNTHMIVLERKVSFLHFLSFLFLWINLLMPSLSLLQSKQNITQEKKLSKHITQMQEDELKRFQQQQKADYKCYKARMKKVSLDYSFFLHSLLTCYSCLSVSGFP